MSAFLPGFHLESDLAVDTLFERDEGFGFCYAGNILDFIVEEFHEVLGVGGDDFDQHRVRAGGEMTLHYFGNFLEFIYDVAIHRTFFESDADVGASVETEFMQVDAITGSVDDSDFDESGDALMYSGSAYIAIFCNFFRCDARVAHDDV